MAYNNNYNSQPQYNPGGYRQQQPQQMPFYQPIPAIRPVTSLEEVRASPIDFDGSVFYFTDMANKRIYTKQIGMDGTAVINLYEQKEIQPIEKTINNYVTKEEFENTISQLVKKYEELLANSPEQAKKPAFNI